MKNPPVTGHPAKDSVITIEPFRTLDEIAAVRAVIISTRDRAMFMLGINSNLRASDLLRVRAEDVDWMEGKLTVRERKTKKKRIIPLGAATLALLADCLPLSGEGLLFPSNKGRQPLTIGAWNNRIKLWARKAGLTGNYGARTVRKTWARIQHDVYGVGILNISVELNHSSLRQTYFYLCLTPPEQAEIFRNQI